jgi:hypothetical protein
MSRSSSLRLHRCVVGLFTYTFHRILFLELISKAVFLTLFYTLVSYLSWTATQEQVIGTPW